MCFLPLLALKGRTFLTGPLIALRPSLSMDSSLESGGGDARCSCSSARRNLAAVFFIQSLLAAMCAAFSLYIFFNQTSGSHKETGIYLDMTRDEFTAIWNKSVALKDKKTLVLSCAGPYMVYLWTCVRSYGSVKTANLTMQQGNKIVYQHTLHGNEENGCQETQSVIMLSQKREVTFKLEHFKIEISRLHLGLHYMLGAQCFPDPPS